MKFLAKISINNLQLTLLVKELSNFEREVPKKHARGRASDCGISKLEKSTFLHFKPSSKEMVSENMDNILIYEDKRCYLNTCINNI